MYDEAMKAKNAGDDKGWQQPMGDARNFLKGLRDEWIVFEEEVAEIVRAKPSEGWGVDEVMDAYFKTESTQVQKLIDEKGAKMLKTGH